MTTTKSFDQRNRDIQDGFERHVFEELTYVEGAGAVIRVSGTGTVDEDVPVINTGYGFSVPKGFNTECFLQSDGSDSAGKFGVMTLPRDKQRKWNVNTGGVQNPIDPEKALEFNQKRTHVTEEKFAVGEGAFEVIGDTIYIRGNLSISGDLKVGGTIQAGGNISTAGRYIGPEPSGRGEPPDPIPGFDA